MPDKTPIQIHMVLNAAGDTISDLSTHEGDADPAKGNSAHDIQHAIALREAYHQTYHVIEAAPELRAELQFLITLIKSQGGKTLRLYEDSGRLATAEKLIKHSRRVHVDGLEG